MGVGTPLGGRTRFASSTMAEVIGSSASAAAAKSLSAASAIEDDPAARSNSDDDAAVTRVGDAMTRLSALKESCPAAVLESTEPSAPRIIVRPAVR
jgi:hypothetical protein